MDVLNPECAAQSVGPANQLFGLLIQTILAAQCAISPKDMWPQDYGPTAVEQGLGEYDFIVVGAGSAGSVVASRLSENPNWKVLLLEAGGDPPIESEIPFLVSSLQNTSVDWGYSIEKTKKIGKLLAHNVTWPSGKLIGGSAAMNVRFYVRGNPHDYNEWEYAGNPTWNWQNLLQYFKKAENYQTETVSSGNAVTPSGVDELFGRTGPLPINSFVNEQPFKQTLFDAAQELGYKQLADVNGNEYIGIGRAPGTLSQGKLFNAAKAYLSPARNRTNLHVIKHAHVTKVNVDNTTGQVTGVTFQINQTHELAAVSTKDTILSAGSIGTPKILQLSGIGTEKYLTRLNISLVRNLNTGFNLQNHITVPLFIQFNVSDVQTSETITAEGYTNETISASTAQEGVDSTDALYDYIKQRTDISGLQNIFDVHGFFSTVGSPYPNIGTQYAVFKQGDDILLREYLRLNIGLNETVAQPIIVANKVADIAVVFVTLLNPITLGKVRLRSADPYDAPLIQSNYLDRPEDVSTLVQGVQLARTFLQATPFQQLNASEVILSIPECETVQVKKKKVKPPPTPKPPKDKSKKDKKKKGEPTTTTTTPAPPPVEPEPIPEPIPYGSDQYFECYVKQVSTTPYQPVGTSKMGPAVDRFAVVDPRLKVHQLNGLRVVDASVIPKITSAPIDAITIAIAEKGSDIIKEDWAAIEAAAAAAPEAPATEPLKEEL